MLSLCSIGPRLYGDGALAMIQDSIFWQAWVVAAWRQEIHGCLLGFCLDAKKRFPRENENENEIAIGLYRLLVVSLRVQASHESFKS